MYRTQRFPSGTVLQKPALSDPSILHDWLPNFHRDSLRLRFLQRIARRLASGGLYPRLVKGSVGREGTLKRQASIYRANWAGIGRRREKRNLPEVSGVVS